MKQKGTQTEISSVPKKKRKIEESQQCSGFYLPIELWANILQSLSYEDVKYRVQFVCKEWREFYFYATTELCLGLKFASLESERMEAEKVVWFSKFRQLRFLTLTHLSYYNSTFESLKLFFDSRTKRAEKDGEDGENSGSPQETKYSITYDAYREDERNMARRRLQNCGEVFGKFHLDSLDEHRISSVFSAISPSTPSRHNLPEKCNNADNYHNTHDNSNNNVDNKRSYEKDKGKKEQETDKVSSFISPEEKETIGDITSQDNNNNKSNNNDDDNKIINEKEKEKKERETKQVSWFISPEEKETIGDMTSQDNNDNDNDNNNKKQKQQLRDSWPRKHRQAVRFHQTQRRLLVHRPLP